MAAKMCLDARLLAGEPVIEDAVVSKTPSPPCLANTPCLIETDEKEQPWLLRRDCFRQEEDELKRWLARQLGSLKVEMLFICYAVPDYAKPDQWLSLVLLASADEYVHLLPENPRATQLYGRIVHGPVICCPLMDVDLLFDVLED